MPYESISQNLNGIDLIDSKSIFFYPALVARLFVKWELSSITAA